MLSPKNQNPMSQPLRTDLLLQTVGVSVRNHKGESMGKIVEVIRDKVQKNIQYVVLQCDTMPDMKNRFFAIPASTTLIKITTGGQIVLKVDKEEVQQANSIPFDQCPKPNFQFKPSIFEIHQYEVPAAFSEPISSTEDRILETETHIV